MAEVKFPDTSYQGREKLKNDPPSEKKTVKKVTTGAVKTRKKSELKRFAGIFVPEDTSSVKSYILMDVIVPGIKNALADVVSIMLFGETGRLSGGKRRNGGGTSYQRFYDDPRERERRDYSRPKAGYEFDDIFFETRADAELVLDQLEEIISIYGMASVLDLYDSAGVSPPNYNAQNFGWTDIRNAKPIRVRDGYILQLPKALPIT